MLKVGDDDPVSAAQLGHRATLDDNILSSSDENAQTSDAVHRDSGSLLERAQPPRLYVDDAENC
jgi:hypothetical protein